MEFDIIVVISDEKSIDDSKGMEYIEHIITKINNSNKKDIIITDEKTWDSLKSKNLEIIYLDRKTLQSFDPVLEFLDSNDNKGNIFVIGGLDIYSIAFNHKKCEDIYIINIGGDYAPFFSSVPQYFVNIESPDHKIIKYTNISDRKSDEYQYLNLIKTILNEGDIKNGRNGKTLSIFGPQHTFDLQKGFPLLTTKKMFIEGIIKEILFFLKGQTNSKLLSQSNVKIWDKNTTSEFLKSRGLNYEEGDMGPMYGFNWRHFGCQYQGCNVDYSNKGYDQLKELLKSLINDKDSRRHIMTTYNPINVQESVLAPCHGLTIQFYVNSNKLNCKMYQRSVDVGLGYPFNIASYATLIHIICKVTGYIPGNLIMTLGDTHIYEQHIDKLKLQIDRVPLKFPQIKINSNFTIENPTVENMIEYIENLKYEDFIIEGYNHYPGIKLDMIA